MQEHITWIAEAFNSLVVKVALLLGFQVPEGHGELVPQPAVMALVVMVILIVMALYTRSRLSVDNPNGWQQTLELFFETVQGLLKDLVGHHSQRYFPLIAGFGLFILVSNWLGMIPGFISPTASLNCTAALGISSFLYYNYQGFRVQGFMGYLKHFMGPVALIAPLMFVIELVSHFARPFSLSVRLFGNIYAEELVINTLNSAIFPFLVSIPVMFLGLFASTLQAFIFMLLSMVYIGGAVEEGHH